MLKNLLFFCLIIIGNLGISAFAQYGVRGMNDIDIISRTEWGADESLKYFPRDEYNEILRNKKEYIKYLTELKETNIEKYIEIKKSEYEENRRNEYLTTNFAADFKIDKTNDEEYDSKLWWPMTYKYKKTQIIIHHTVNDYDKYENSGDVKILLRNIYRYHAFTRGWGDIGYHFLIDKFGNIYEGRSGGEGIIAAHTKRNNTTSIGIALIGNFEIQKPSPAQIEALIKLSFKLSQKYSIEPFSISTYHIVSSREPFIKDVNNYAIAGHKDAGQTACPGKNLYEQLDNIRMQIKEKISGKTVIASTININKSNQTDILQIPTNVQQTINLPQKYYLTGQEFTFTYPIKFDDFNSKCFAPSYDLEIKECTYNNGILRIKLVHYNGFATGKKKIIILSPDHNVIINLFLIWQIDIDNLIVQMKENYQNKYGRISNPADMTKIIEKINITKAKSMMNQNVKVLLYELSTSFKQRNISCEQNCFLKIDNINFYNVKKLNIKDQIDNLRIDVNGKTLFGNKVELINNAGLIAIDNYKRASYAAYPWNVFRGNIYIQKEKIKLLDGNIDHKFVVINDLPFSNYLQGIAEVNDSVPMEKMKAMSLLIKTYALFYLNHTNPHPSIPADSHYNAVDDARIFQKYVGAGFEKTSKNRPLALETTKNQYLLYSGYLPILPYYSCSAGFTWSGKEKYGWIDTPYLVSRLDFAKCDNFAGHGVGLSGKGAERLANHGFNYKQILLYYYPGVKIN